MKLKLIASPLVAVSLLAFAFGCGGKKDPVDACLDGDDDACESLYYGEYGDDYDDYYSLKIQDDAGALDSSCADVEFQGKAYANGLYDAEKDECVWIGEEDSLICPVSGGECVVDALEDF